MKDDWYCKTMGIEFGPMSFDDLAGLAKRGNLRPGDAVRHSQDGAWIKAAEVPGLIHQAPAATSGTTPSAPASQLGPVAQSNQGVSSIAASAQPLSGQAPTAQADDEAAEETRPNQGHSLALGPYNCAILIGPGGVSVCDLRDCQEVVVAGARVVGHRPAEDETPIRFGPLELQISVREIAERTHPTPQTGTGGAAVEPEPVAVAEPKPDSSTTSDSTKRASKAASRGGSAAETGDIAAEMLRRMFMPRPSKAR